MKKEELEKIELYKKHCDNILDDYHKISDKIIKYRKQGETLKNKDAEICIRDYYNCDWHITVLDKEVKTLIADYMLRRAEQLDVELQMKPIPKFKQVQ